MGMGLSIAIFVLAAVVVIGSNRIGDKNGWSRGTTWHVRQVVSAVTVVALVAAVLLAR
jgi:hypothetical protein